MSDRFTNVGNSNSGAVGDSIQWVLENTIYKLMYVIARSFCWLVDLLYQMFGVFSGITTVNYNGSSSYLINVFFSNNAVSNVYAGMALIGIVLCFGFAIVAVTRKMFDADNKQDRSIGQIISGGLKSILMIICLSLVMTVVLNATSVLMISITSLFDNAEEGNTQEIVEYTDEQYAAMARALNTVGNYSLNPSYNSRYNINSCYNDMRADLQYLFSQGVFDVYYETKDANGRPVVTWQSAL